MNTTNFCVPELNLYIEVLELLAHYFKVNKLHSPSSVSKPRLCDYVIAPYIFGLENIGILGDAKVKYTNRFVWCIYELYGEGDQG